MPRALIVDDEQDFSLGLAEMISREGFETRTAASLAQARAELNDGLPDVILLDMHLPDGSGMELLEEVRAFPTTDVVVITGNGSIDSAVGALQAGASHYLTKPVDFARVQALLASVSRSLELKEQLGNLRDELRRLGRFGPLIGASAPMQRVYDLIGRVAPTDATVFLIGETGTGKEVVAQTLHQLSRRRKEPFMALNCGAVSPNLIESELFGHEKGSFTGANRQHRGLFEQAHRGTVFLDEITETAADLQVKLLRVLETQTFMRIGGDQPIVADTRTIAASNVPPKDAIERGKLREDLFYRLNVFPIQLPPLRDRMDDIPLLAESMLTALNREAGARKEFARGALRRLCSYAWPGNVRELKNMLHRAFILAETEVDFESLPLGDQEALGPNLKVKVGTTLAEAERRLILATLEDCKGDKKKAASLLGISVKSVYNRLNEYKTQR